MAQPEIVFRHGACSASVFAKEISKDNDTFTVKDVNFQRRFRTRDGEWQSTSSLRVNDIPKAVLVLNKAYEYVTSNGHADADDSDN